jgi:hypothetical protein
MHAVTNSQSGHRKCSLLLLIVLQQISTTIPMPVADVESLTSEKIDKNRFKANVVSVYFFINYWLLLSALNYNYTFVPILTAFGGHFVALCWVEGGVSCVGVI